MIGNLHIAYLCFDYTCDGLLIIVLSRDMTKMRWQKYKERHLGLLDSVSIYTLSPG